tara:strand:- start:610 stop:795 length:186 start_codon:yes stop_codon:yes gene_type:complete
LHEAIDMGKTITKAATRKRLLEAAAKCMTVYSNGFNHLQPRELAEVAKIRLELIKMSNKIR